MTDHDHKTTVVRAHHGASLTPHEAAREFLQHLADSDDDATDLERRLGDLMAVRERRAAWLGALKLAVSLALLAAGVAIAWLIGAHMGSGGS